MGFICRCDSHFGSELDNSNIKLILMLSLLDCTMNFLVVGMMSDFSSILDILPIMQGDSCFFLNV